MRRYIFDFLRYLKTEKNVSPHTERSYLSDLEQLFDFLGETDLAMAKAEGWASVLVLSGVVHDADQVPEKYRPDLILPSLADLPVALQS